MQGECEKNVKYMVGYTNDAGEQVPGHCQLSCGTCALVSPSGGSSNLVSLKVWHREHCGHYSLLCMTVTGRTQHPSDKAGNFLVNCEGPSVDSVLSDADTNAANTLTALLYANLE